MPYNRQVFKSWTCAETGHKRVIVEISDGDFVARKEYLCAGSSVTALDLARAYALLEIEIEGGSELPEAPGGDDVNLLPEPTEQEIEDAKADI